MNPLLFAWKSALRHPLRSVLTIVGVAAVGALLFDMLLLSRGLLLSFEDVLESTGYEVRVTATRSLPGVGPRLQEAGATAEALADLDEVAVAVPILFAEAELDGGPTAARVSALGGEPRHRGEWRLLRGVDFDAGDRPPEAVVSASLAEAAGIEPGERLALRPTGPQGGAGILPAVEFRVTGVAEFPFDAAGQLTLATTRRALRRGGFVADSDEADLLLVASREGVEPAATVAAIERLRPDLHSFSIQDFLERFQVSDFSYFRQISFVLASLTSFFAFLLVATVLTVTVNQRLGEVAALRAIGFGRLRVALDLLVEGSLLALLGGVLSIPLGLALARILDAILRAMPDLPERLHFFVFHPRALVVHGLLLAAAGIGAGIWPAWTAVRLPISETLRREVVG